MRRLLMLLMLTASLSVLFSVEASAQFDLSRALGTLLGGGAEQSDTPNPYDVLADNAPARSKILGTWQYKTASVEYLGNNPLAEVAVSQLESLALAELKRRGVVEGCCSLTLRRNGMAVIATLDGIQDVSYSYDETTAKVELKIDSGDATYRVEGYVKMSSGRLIVLIDAHDVLNAMLKASPELATNQSVVVARAALERFNDIYIGAIFER